MIQEEKRSATDEAHEGEVQALRRTVASLRRTERELEGDSAYNRARDFTRAIVCCGMSCASRIPEKTIEAIKNIDDFTG